MAARYKNCLGYDKRDYLYPVEINNDEEEIVEEVRETNEWDEVSLEILEFLRDKVEEMAVPLLDQHFGLFDVIQLFSTYMK